MTRRRDDELALLTQLAAHRTTHAQAALTAIDLKISTIRARIDAVKSPIKVQPADIVDAFAADRWVSARAAHVAKLNLELARDLAARVGAAKGAARAAATEEVLDGTLCAEKLNAARQRTRRSEEMLSGPPKRR